MNTKLIVGASMLMLCLVPMSAMAYTGSRTVVLPGGFDEANTGGAGLAVCERISDDAINPSPSPVYCEATGFSAFFSNIGCSSDFTATSTPIFFGDGKPDNNAGCLDDYDGADPDGDNTPGNTAGNDATFESFAGGDVTVTFSSGLTGSAVALVGNDRDDDGSVTSGDTDGSSDEDCSAQDDPSTAGEPDCYDDEFKGGSTADLDANGIAVNDFCFSRDRSFAGGDWDDIVVFLSADLNGNPLPGAPDVGTAQVDITVNSASAIGDACGAGALRSAHDDGLYNDGGAPVTADAGFLPVGVVAIAVVDGVADVTLDVTDTDCGIALPPDNVGDGTAASYSVTCTANGSLGCAAVVGVYAGDGAGSIQCGAVTTGLTGPADVDTAVPNPAGGAAVCAITTVGTVSVLVCVIVWL